MKHIFGAGLVAGIGFTMSIFITILAFEQADIIKSSKLSIIIASLISAILGLVFLTLSNKPKMITEIREENE